jgi:zinc finger SWIM domain-containing protein 3
MRDPSRYQSLSPSQSELFTSISSKAESNQNLNGTPEEGYANLPEYEKLLQANLGGSIFLKTITSDIGNNFRRLFIAYKAAIDGFVHCRVLLGLDGTHLTSKYGGILLTATATDARGQLFSLIFAVVSARNDSNCEWFINHIHFIH